MRLARYNRFAIRLLAFAFGCVHTLLGCLLVAGKSRRLGLFALVPRVAAIAGTWRQTGVLGQDFGGRFLGHFMAAGRRRVLATGTLVAVGRRLVQRDQLV